MATSLIPLGVFGLTETQGLWIGSWSNETLLIVIGIGLSSSVGFLCWLYALSLVPTAHVTAFLGLSPVTAALLAFVIEGTVLTASVMMASLLIMIALMFLVFAE